MTALELAESRSGPEMTGRIDRLPVLLLFPHSRCNCRCVMCDIWRSRGRDEIAPEEVLEWLPELRRLGVEQVALSGGEALLNSRLREICEMLHEAGIRITLLSTGILLPRHAGWIARLVADIVVSLDGPADIHNAIRGLPDAFTKLREGIRSIRTLRDDLPITGRCVVQKANHQHLRETVRAAREIGLDRISFLAADVSSEAFNRPEGWGAERAESVALSLGNLDALGAEIEAMERELRPEFASGFIAESPEKLRTRILRHYRALAGEDTFAPVSCRAPWISCVVEANGDVRPCFFHRVVGNVRESGGLEAVLNSPAAVAFRRDLDVRTNPTCARCVCTLSAPEHARRAS
jgi:MoaA/NifB/PqqE/SkfB family radical SAM enzyme